MFIYNIPRFPCMLAPWIELKLNSIFKNEMQIGAWSIENLFMNMVLGKNF
jgi:hypothetical protein